MGKITKREYWLDNYKGPCKDGYFFRSSIFKEIDEFEKRTGRHVVAIKMDRKHESSDPSYNIEFVLEVTVEDLQKEIDKDGGEDLTMIQKMGLSNMAKTIASGTDPIHEAEEADKYDEYSQTHTAHRDDEEADDE